MLFIFRKLRRSFFLPGKVRTCCAYAAGEIFAQIRVHQCVKSILVFSFAMASLKSLGDEPLIINNAHILDGLGGEILEGAVLIRDGRFAIIKKGEISVPSVRIIDADGMVLMPGITDLHVHSTLEIRVNPEEDSGGFPDSDSSISSDEEMQAFIEQRLPERMRSFLETGVTTIVDPGGLWPYVLEIRDKVNNGTLEGPRMFVVGPVFTAPGAHPASTVCNENPWCADRLTISTDSPEEAREQVRKLAAAGVDGLKFVYDGLNYLPHQPVTPQLGVEVMEAIVAEGKEWDLPILAHVHRADDAADAADAGAQVLVHWPGLTTSDGRSVVEILSKAKIPVMATVRWSDPELLPPEKRQQKIQNLEKRRILRTYNDNGVEVLFGTDFDGKGTRADLRANILSTFNVLQLIGFSASEIFLMITGKAAIHPMIPDDLGTIAVGNKADLLLVRGDPRKDIDLVTEPELVIKDGRIMVNRR